MTRTPRPATGMNRWRVAAAALVLLATVCLAIGTDRPAAPGPSAAAATAQPLVSDRTPRTPDRLVEPDPPAPVQLAIPALELDTRLISLGVQPDRTVEVPTDPDRAGWFRRGTAPGAIGSAVILGHVDSVDGPAVFAGLKTLVPGAHIDVLLEDGSTARFEVHSVKTYDNEAFPAEQVYGSHGRRELNLVTCGGDYDSDRGGYQSNVVVNARWIRTSAA